MTANSVTIKAVLDESGITRGAKNIKATLESIRNEDGSLNWSGLLKGETAVQKLTNAMKSVGTGMTLGITVPLVAAGTAAVTMASNFDNAMAKVSTIADTTEVPMDDLREAILELSNQTGISCTDIADNVYNAISAGQKTGDAVNFVSNATRLAKAGFTDSASALDVLTTTMNAYGMSADQVGRVSDVLITTQNKGKTTVAELAASMGRAIPTASAFHVSLENLAAAYATTTANGISTAESTTYINSMLKELGDSGSDVGGIIKDKLGMSFSECMSSGMSLGDVLNVLSESAAESGETMYDLFSSSEAATAAASIAGDGCAKFAENLDAMNSSAGATDAAMANLQTDSAKVTKVINEGKNTLMEFGTVILASAAPAIETVCGALKAAMDALHGMDDGTRAAIVTVLAVIAAIGPLLAIAAQVITAVQTIAAVVSLLIPSISAAAAAVTAALGPVGLAIAAITAVVAAIVYLWNTNEDFRNAIVSIWDAICSAVSAAVEAVSSAVSAAWDAICSYVTAKVQAVQTVVTVGFAVIQAVASAVWSAVQSATSSAWSAVTSTVSSCVNSAKSAVSSAVSGIQSTVSSGFNAALSVATSVFDGIHGAIRGAMDGAVSVVQGAVGALQSALNFSWSLPHLALPHFSVSGEFSLNPLSVPSFSVSWYQKGAIAMGASVVGIGENGPEAIVPLSSSRMNPFADAVAERMEEKSRDVGGNVYNITLTFPVEKLKDFATVQEFVEMIKRTRRDNPTRARS